MPKPPRSTTTTLVTGGRNMDHTKSRPCVIFRGGKRGNNQIVVHLMASFENSEEVPEVFRPFMAEISTSTGCFTDHKRHLHTSPEWPSSSRQWIIILPTSIQSVSLSRWQKSGKTGYHFSRPMFDQFREIINEYSYAWDMDVKSKPGFLRQYRQKFIEEHQVTSRCCNCRPRCLCDIFFSETPKDIQPKHHCAWIDEAWWQQTSHWQHQTILLEQKTSILPFEHFDPERFEYFDIPIFTPTMRLSGMNSWTLGQFNPLSLPEYSNNYYHMYSNPSIHLLHSRMAAYGI